MSTRFTANAARTVEEQERIALEREYREHLEWLRAAARRRIGSSDVAEDLVQEAFIRAARYPGAKRQARPLLRSILSNLLKDLFRAKARERAALFGMAVVAPAEAALPEQVETVLLADVVVGMPSKLRDVFVLARFSPLTQLEIAERLGVSVKTVEWRLARALQYCAARLAE